MPRLEGVPLNHLPTSLADSLATFGTAAWPLGKEPKSPSSSVPSPQISASFTAAPPAGLRDQTEAFTPKPEPVENPRKADGVVRSGAGDYVVFVAPDNKLLFGKVMAAREGSVDIALADHRLDRPDAVLFQMMPAYAVLANIGTSPPIGMGAVYGVAVDPILKVLNQPPFDRIELLCSASEAYEAAFMESVKTYAGWFHASGMLPNKPIVLRVKSPKYETGQDGSLVLAEVAQGFKPGSYKSSAKGADVLTMTLPAESWINHALVHDLAHVGWSRQASSSIKIAWQEAYLHYTSHIQAMDGVLSRLKEDLVEQGSVNALKDVLGDSPQALMLARAVKQIRELYRLSRQEIDIVLLEGRTDILDKIWPTAIDVVQVSTSISELAASKPSRFFAETLAYGLLGTRPVPQSLADLMLRTTGVRAVAITEG